MVTWAVAQAILSLIWAILKCLCEWVPWVLIWMVAAPIVVPMVAILWACKLNVASLLELIDNAIRSASQSITSPIASAVRWALKAFLDIPSKWEQVFVISCIAVSLDPLFFYVPIIDETNKCLSMDKKLRTTALVLRSLTDAPLVLHIKYQICGCVDSDYPNWSDSDSNSDSDSDSDSDDSEATACSLKIFKKWIAKRMPWLSFSIIVDCLAILPIPQVAILVGFYKMGGSSRFEVSIKRTTLNASLALQYLPRICQIYLSSKKFRTSGRWIKPSLNLFLYILSSHVFAAFWYFFAIEREISCWHQTCKNTPRCVASFDCSSSANTSRNITVLNQLCPIKSPNTTVFDFGIYLSILQSGNTGNVGFLTKLVYSLWWGLKNLSNFGTNLETSSYMWENCFAIIICVSGLLLFLYLIGNMQKYMELETTKSLKIEESRRQKIQAKKGEIKTWMSNNGISGSMENRIKKYIKQYNVVEKNMKADVDVTFFLDGNRFGNSTTSIRELFSWSDTIREHLVQNAVEKVPMLKALDYAKLKSLSQLMKPVVRGLDSHIVKRGDQLDQMLFVIEGAIDVENPHDLVSKNDYYGREILQWVSFNYTRRSYCETLPRSIGLVKSCGRIKLEALALDAWDLLKFLEEEKFDINDPEAKELADAYGRNMHKYQKISSMPPSSPATPSTSTADPPDGPWNPPAPGWVKLNCSHVWDDSNKKACMGFVLRNDKEEIIAAGGVGSYQSIDSFQAGALSISYCLKKSLQHVKTSHRIVVESDDKLFIDLLIDLLKKLPLHNDPQVRGILRPTLQNIANVVSKFNGHKFVSCSRQANEAALLEAEHARDEHAPAPGSEDWKNAKEIKGLSTALKVNDSRATTSAAAALEEIRTSKE